MITLDHHQAADSEIQFVIEVKQQQLQAITAERVELVRRETKTFREMQMLEHVLARRRAHRELQLEMSFPRQQVG